MRKISVFFAAALLLLFTACGQEKNDTFPEAAVSVTSESEVSPVPEESEAEIGEEVETELKPESETETEAPEELSHDPIKGIYVSAWVAGTAERMDEMIAGIDATELNAIVIDVKDDEGRIVWNADSPLISETGAVRVLVEDMPGLIERLHEHGIYVIGRLVCFRDAYIDQAKPEWVIHNENGTIYRDEKDFAWIDPRNTEARDYLLEVADACMEVGFDEVQFDYVRYPTKATEAMVGVDGEGRKAEITDFAEYAAAHFKEIGMPFSMDVFGIVIHAEYDRKIVGQDYAALSTVAGALSPMVYPSHYADGTYGIGCPDLYPYEIVRAAMDESRELLETATEGAGDAEATDGAVESSENTGVTQAIIRPWLQGFTADYLTHYTNYGPAEIRAQIQAVYDAGYEEWLIWDPSEHYPWDVFLPAAAPSGGD